MLPKPLLQGIEAGADVLILNVQYLRARKKEDGSYTPDYLHVVYRDNTTGKKHLQIITNPTTDIYVVKPEHRDDFRTPREYVPFAVLDKHSVPYREKERYLYKLLGSNLLSERDKLLKQSIDRATELGIWNARNEVHKWRNVYFSDYDIENYAYITANLHYKPTSFKLTKSFMDIETDVYGKSRHDQETGKCKISAVTIIYDYAVDGSKNYKPKVFTLLLRDYKRYPQQEEFERNIDTFYEKVHEEFDKKYGNADYHILFFDREDEMLLTLFKLQHTLKPDFTGIWNMSYDILYIQKKLEYLGIDPAAMFSHPDFKNTHINYYLDEKFKNDYKNRGDSFNCLSYTKYVDDMLTYAGRRKGGQDYGSSSLDNVASIELKEKKRTYDNPGVNVINAAIREYENFVLYGITDVWLLTAIERKTGDIDDVFLKGYESGTKIDKANRQTVSLKGLWDISHFEQGFVFGNNLNVSYLTRKNTNDEEVEAPQSGAYVETLKGALVGDPVAINPIGVALFDGERSNRIFKNNIDLDAKAMYPSNKLVNNTTRSTQHGRLIIPDKVSPLEYGVSPHLRGGEFVDDFETKDYIKIGIKWFGLRRVDEYVREFILYRNKSTKKALVKKKKLGEFYKLWSDKMYSVLSVIFPADIALIYPFLSRVFKRDHKDTDCVLFNSYEDIEYDTTLLSIVDWIIEVRPIMTESGTFFKRHEEGPISPGLKTIDGLIKQRDVLKEIEIQHEKRNELEEAKDYKLRQNRKKTFTNSEYGVSGAPSSAFYSYHVAQSTTSKGQTYIALAMTTFEDFLCDTIQFYDMDELFHFCDNVIREMPKFNDAVYVTKDKTKKEVLERLLRKCQNIKDLDTTIIKELLSNIPQTALNRLYYKSNIHAFIEENVEIQKLIRTFFINTPLFMNPNKPPAMSERHLKKLTDVILEYCQYNYPYYGRVDRLIRINRNAVIVIDTDSNIICVDDMMNRLNNYMETKSISRISRKGEKSDRVAEERRLRSMNTVAYILTEVISRVLNKFKVDTNAQNHPFGDYKMKNEFGILSLLVASGKKRYLQSIILREGEYLWPPKKHIAGFDFKKLSAAPKSVGKFIESTLFEYIVCDNTDIPEALRQFMKLENKLRGALQSGDKEYFSIEKVKTMDSYKDAMSNGTFKACYIWNALYPDKEISFPNSVSLVKINIKSTKDIADLALDDREMFDRMSEILKRPTMKTGVTQIAIPLDEDIPDWILKRMDIETMLNKNMGLVTPILEEIGVRPVYKRKSDQYISNVISI